MGVLIIILVFIGSIFICIITDELRGSYQKCQLCGSKQNLYSIEHNGKALYFNYGLSGNTRERSKILCKHCLEEQKSLGATFDILAYNIKKLN